MGTEIQGACARVSVVLTLAAALLLSACSSPPTVPLGERPMPSYRDGVVLEVRDFTVTDYGSRAPGGAGVSVGVAGGSGGRSGGGVGIGFGLPLPGFGMSGGGSTSTRVYDITVKPDTGEPFIVRQLPTEPAPAIGARVRVITENGVARVTPLGSN
ncbi:MAG: hypothetical protein ACREUW_07215 [Burkholderiales bacterium]